MKYNYYEKVEMAEHFYFAEEIIEFLSLSNMLPPNFTARKLHSLVREYESKTNEFSRKLYHQTRNGLKRVYDITYVSHIVMNHISDLNQKKKEDRV